MFLGLGVGAYSLALFHLGTHACFKALLFMGAGVVINAYQGDHDIRNMGGLAGEQPYLRLVFLAGSLALAAVPFISSGFYSKDPIIESAWTAPHGGLLWGLAILGAVLTGAYAFRLYFMVFHGPKKGETVEYRMPWAMRLPLTLLAVASLTLGFVQFPEGWHLPRLVTPWLAAELGMPQMPHGGTAVLLRWLGIVAPLVGIALAIPIVRSERAGRGTSSVGVLAQGWYLDAIYDALVVKTLFRLRAGIEHGGRVLVAERRRGRLAGLDRAGRQPRAEHHPERQCRPLCEPHGAGRGVDHGVFPVAAMRGRTC